jgi:hypothetical protein
MAIRERSLCPGREPRAMYQALFEVGDNPDWSQVSVRNRPIVVDDQAVRSWLLLARQREIPHVVDVVLARRGDRDNTLTIHGSPHLIPDEPVEFAGLEPCYNSDGDELSSRKNPNRKLACAASGEKKSRRDAGAAWNRGGCAQSVQSDCSV